MSKRGGKSRRKRDFIDVAGMVVPSSPIAAATPTPEQSQHAVYTERQIHDRLPDGTYTTRGRHWRRQPRFETMISDLSLDQLFALRRYRAAFDTSEMSATKSALDIRPGGGAGGAEAVLSRLEQIAFADHELRRIEEQVPSGMLPILRAVALQDMDFTQAAITLFGSRLVSRIDVTVAPARHVVSVAPKSGRHRERVKDMFLLAAAALARATGSPSPTNAAPREPRPVAADPLPALDPRFLDERGLVRSFEEIRGILLAPDDEA